MNTPPWDAAMRFVTDWSVAIDGGAHVGTWTVPLAERFAQVMAFEPTHKTFSTLLENVAGTLGVECRMEALFDQQCRATIEKRRKGAPETSNYIRPAKLGEIHCTTIDALDLPACGLIKLDLEGAELHALRGAQRTIKRFSPVLVIEIGGLSRRYGVSPGQIAVFLEEQGYRRRVVMGVDHVFVR